MKRILRRRPTPAFVLAAVALFVALGGSAYALTVTGANVQNGSLTGADIREGSVPGSKLRKNSVTSLPLRHRSLKGTLMQKDSVGYNAVKEEGLDASKFRKVKSAESADSVAGLAVTPLAAFSLDPGQTKGVGNVGPLTFTARCRTDGPKQIAEIVAQTNQNGSAVAAAETDASFSIGELAALARVESPEAAPAFSRQPGAAIVTPDGTEILADLYVGVSTLAQPGKCRFGGVLYGI